MSSVRRPAFAWRLAAHALVYVIAAAMLAPFAWMVLTSLKTDAEASSQISWPTILPSVPQWRNFAEAWRSAQLDRFYMNSFVAACVLTVLGVAHNGLAGFAFAKMRFRGRGVLLWVTLATMMFPVQIYFLFAYAIAGRLGHVNSLSTLIVPFLASGFGIYYMRQAISAVPDSLLEAGRLDGMGNFELFWTVVRPSTWASMAALSIFTFMFSWNNFFWPLIAIDSVEHKTLPLAIADLSAGLYVHSWPVQMAAATIMTLPLILVFLVAQRAFVRGITLTGIKE
jgi:ABC-type glycerol-3-phosphate transport system permease component